MSCEITDMSLCYLDYNEADGNKNRCSQVVKRDSSMSKIQSKVKEVQTWTIYTQIQTYLSQ